MSDKNKIRSIAIYLPQYHPIPENDEWWGKGFTEWTNVTKGEPRFEGHYQPHLPSDLGFYDLRLEESRMAQEALAKQNNIHGFCYYHYWFNGKRMLYEPLERKLKNPKEDLPFMLCWANENWTRAWDGTENQVLLQQNYSEEDDRNHIRYLISYFKDDRYIKVNGKPIFAFYKADVFPDMNKTVQIFREEARKEGIELYLCWVERWGGNYEHPYFDAAIEFQPLSKPFTAFLDHQKEEAKKNQAKSNQLSIPERVKNKIIRKLNSYRNTKPQTIKRSSDIIVEYGDFTKFDVSYPKRTYKYFPGVCPMWDNSSRRRNQVAIIFKNSTPELFGNWYKKKVENFTPYSEQENFIFINAWNEWAEGNHLEPDQKWGKQYLEALR